MNICINRVIMIKLSMIIYILDLRTVILNVSWHSVNVVVDLIRSTEFDNPLISKLSKSNLK